MDTVRELVGLEQQTGHQLQYELMEVLCTVPFTSTGSTN